MHQQNTYLEVGLAQQTNLALQAQLDAAVGRRSASQVQSPLTPSTRPHPWLSLSFPFPFPRRERLLLNERGPSVGQNEEPLVSARRRCPGRLTQEEREVPVYACIISCIVSCIISYHTT